MVATKGREDNFVCEVISNTKPTIIDGDDRNASYLMTLITAYGKHIATEPSSNTLFYTKDMLKYFKVYSLRCGE